VERRRWPADGGGVVAVRGSTEERPFAFHFLQALAEGLRGSDNADANASAEATADRSSG
jgi:hypothetical protein